MSDEIDKGLISRFQNGDEAAFEAIITEHKGLLFRFIYRYVRDAGDAEDLLSRTFVNAWRHRASYRPKAQFKTWLFAIATNLCRDHARRVKRRPADFAKTWEENEIEPAATGDPPAEAAVRGEESAMLHAAIDELPHDLKSAVVLFCIEGHTQEEAAQLLGCTPKAIETRVYRAKKRLRGLLRKLRR